MTNENTLLSFSRVNSMGVETTLVTELLVSPNNDTNILAAVMVSLELDDPEFTGSERVTVTTPAIRSIVAATNEN